MISQDYDKNRFEIIVVDGMSEDGTQDIIKYYMARNNGIRHLINRNKIIPSAMNIGISNAKGDVIMKVDSHTSYSSDYISKCVHYLYDYNADNVGGIIKIFPRENNYTAKAIAHVLSHPFGVGNSYFRIGCKVPIWADTAFSGCYKKELFERIGLYDENIARSEDVNINSRIKKIGGKILLVPDIVSNYYARSDIASFLKHNFDNGFWITFPLKYGKVVFSWRHLIPLMFVLSILILAILSLFYKAPLYILLLIVGLYFTANITVSICIALKEYNACYAPMMLYVFTILHFSYGIGSFWGMISIPLKKDRIGMQSVA
jgi:glycosyltransferase involved in cell wall biosynthesis